MKKKTNYYTKVYRSFIEQEDLTRDAKILYVCLMVYVNNKFQCWPSYSLICRNLGMTDKTLTKYINELIEKGYIKCEQNRENGQRFANNIYTILK